MKKEQPVQNTNDKQNARETRPSAGRDTKKQAKSVKKFMYETTFKTLTLSDKAEISKLLKSESNDVLKRIKERGVKVSDITKLSKYGHNQLLNGKLNQTSMKYWITVKSGKKVCINISSNKVK